MIHDLKVVHLITGVVIEVAVEALDHLTLN